MLFRIPVQLKEYNLDDAENLLKSAIERLTRINAPVSIIEWYTKSVLEFTIACGFDKGQAEEVIAVVKELSTQIDERLEKEKKDKEKSNASSSYTQSNPKTGNVIETLRELNKRITAENTDFIEKARISNEKLQVETEKLRKLNQK